MTDSSDEPGRLEESSSANDPLSEAIKSVVALLAEHPGFMTTSTGIEVLHADWPAYPVGHGRRAALLTLAEYPAGTQFFRVDNIDRCTLMSVGRPLRTNSGSPAHLFVAAWDADLLALAKANLIEGVSDEEGYPFFAGQGAALNLTGLELAVTYELTLGVDDRILDQVEPLLEIGRLDAAVREASILLEQALRRLVSDQQQLHGTRLIDKVFEQLLGRFPLPNSLRLQLKAEFLRFFAYVRNEYAHNIGRMDTIAASRALRRCSRLLNILDELRLRSG